MSDRPPRQARRSHRSLRAFGGRGPRLLLVELLLLAAAATGCTNDDVLDGTWRQPADGAGVGGKVSYELVLGQYVADVAGIVRLYERRGPLGGQWELYGAQQYCRQLEDGHFVSDTLSFQFNDPAGQRWSYVLRYDADRERLIGNGSYQSGDGEMQEGPLLEFGRFAEDTSRECDWLNELVLHGAFERGDVPLKGDWRVTVAYVGYDGEVPCLAEAKESAPLDETLGLFSLIIGHKPPNCYAIHRSGKAALAWGVFVLFEDADKDGYWDRNPLLQDQMEPLIGVSSEWVLVYLDGSLASVVTDENHPLFELSEQGYSLLRVNDRDEHGEVRGLTRVPGDAISSTSIALSPADQAPAPRLALP